MCNTIASCFSLTSPLLLVAIAACLGACYILSLKNQSQKIAIFGKSNKSTTVGTEVLHSCQWKVGIKDSLLSVDSKRSFVFFTYYHIAVKDMH